MTRSRPTDAACPYCHGVSRLEFTGRDFNRHVSDEQFNLFRCGTCGLRFIGDPPADLGRYYPDDYHFVPTSAGDLEPHLEGQRFKIELLKLFVGGGALLEIGPSNGVFCRLAQQAGFQVSAIEMDQKCVRFLQDRLQVRTVASADPDVVLSAEERTYDVICLWHSIEHLSRPWKVLAAAASRLKPRGVLVVAAPNPDAWQARLLGARWPHYDMPRHLFALPIPWLTELGQKHGLITELVTTRDAGSLRCNRAAWAMLLQSLAGYKVLRGLPWRTGVAIGRLLQPWEGREGRGAAYTVVLRRPN